VCIELSWDQARGCTGRRKTWHRVGQRKGGVEARDAVPLGQLLQELPAEVEKLCGLAMIRSLKAMHVG